MELQRLPSLWHLRMYDYRQNIGPPYSESRFPNFSHYASTRIPCVNQRSSHSVLLCFDPGVSFPHRNQGRWHGAGTQVGRGESGDLDDKIQYTPAGPGIAAFFVFYWNEWCLDAFRVLARVHFFTRSRGVAYSARPIYIIGRYTSQLPCYMQAVYRCLNEACPWYQPKKLPCNFSIPISIQNLPPWSLHCGGPWGMWFLQWSRRWIKWRFAPGWKIGSLSV